MARQASAGRRRAAARAHRQPVQRDRRGPGHSACGLCQRLARPRPRSLVLRAHQSDHRQFGRGGHGLCPGTRPSDPHRYPRHGQGHRRGGQSGEVPAAGLRQFPRRASLDPGAADRLSDRRRRQDSRHRGDAERRALSGPAKSRHGPRQERPGHRHRAGADRARRRHQIAEQFQRHLPLRAPPGECAGVAAIARDARQRRRISASRAAPDGGSGRLRADVCGHRPDLAVVGHLDRHVVREPPGRADPPIDGRGASRSPAAISMSPSTPSRPTAIWPSSAPPSTP